LEGSVHQVDGGFVLGEPDFEGESALMEEHGEAVCGLGFSGLSIEEELGGAAVDGFVNQVRGLEEVRWDWGGISGLHAEGAALEQDVGL
jgi:hypothetical protein